MCRVVSCPACRSVDSRAHHHSLVYYALRCYGSFLSLSTSSLTVSATTTITIVISSIQSPTTTTSITSCSFFSFFISSPPSSNLKKSQFQRKESTFFCQATPNPANLQIHKLHSFFIIFLQCTDSTSSLSTQLHSIFLVVLITVGS